MLLNIAELDGDNNIVVSGKSERVFREYIRELRVVQVHGQPVSSSPGILLT